MRDDNVREVSGKQKNVEQGLKMVYEAPTPVKKDQFLKQMAQETEERAATQQGENYIGLLFAQISYIRKIVWLAAVAFLGLAIWAFPRLQGDTVWVMAECSPLLALLMVLETLRSKRFGMWEMETVARFSLRSVMLSRVSIIGIFDVLVLLATAVFLASRVPYGVCLVSAYLLLPLLVTALGGMLIELTSFGRGNGYAAPGFALLVAGCFWAAREFEPALFSSRNGLGWEMMTVFVFLLNVMVFRRMMREEFTWNW